MAGEIEAKLKAERMFAEAQAKALGGPYANISKEYVNKYMDSSSLSKALAERVSTNYSLGYLSGWAGIPGDMLNALTSWAVSGIPDQRLRQQAKRSLTVAGTEEIGEAMGADVESEAFQWGTVGLPGLEDLVKRSPYLATVLFGIPGKGPVIGRQGKLLAKAKLGDTPHQYDRATNTIQLDKKYWKSMSSEEKLQMLRHEEGHSFFSTKMKNGETIVKDLADNNKEALRDFANNRYLGKELKEDDSIFHYQEKAEEMLAEYWADRRMGADLDYWDNLGITEKLESAYQEAFSAGKD